VLVLCWSVKGGSGTTVVASSLSLVLAGQSPDGALLVDLVGDSSAVLGIADDSSGAGVVDWLMAGDDVGAESLESLESAIGGGLRLLAVGESSSDAIPPHRWRLLGEILANDPRPVVVDCGASSPPRGLRIAASSSLIVTRLCYLSLRRAAGVGDLATGVVVVKEHGRALSGRDAARIIGRPIVAEVPLDPEVARAVDAGLLLARLPHSISRSLRRVHDLAA
jgi:MinD-like ATPase involved in chromosome partitioning or flagellar assembly